MQPYQAAMQKYFPGAVKMQDFVDKTAHVLGKLNFNGPNSICITSVCRDELTVPYQNALQRVWGEAFPLGGLAGYPTAGITGLGAAMHHAPNSEGQEKYVFFIGPHVSISEDGRLGDFERYNRKGNSGACGSLLGFFSKARGNPFYKANSNPLDIEQSAVESALVGKIRELSAIDDPDEAIQMLTLSAGHAINDAIDKIFHAHGLTLNGSNYVIVSGVLIHTPEGDYVQHDSGKSFAKSEKGLVSLL